MNQAPVPPPGARSLLASVEEARVAKFGRTLAHLLAHRIKRSVGRYAPLAASSNKAQVVAWAAGHAAAEVLASTFREVLEQESARAHAVSSLKSAGADPAMAAGAGAPSGSAMTWLATTLSLTQLLIRKRCDNFPVTLLIGLERGSNGKASRLIVP